MSARHMLGITVALLISACSIGRPIPTVTTYSIEPPAAMPGARRSPLPERLRVERVHVAAPYDRSALVYRLTAVRYISDPYHAFLADPGPMLGDRMAEWLSAAGVFKTVDSSGSDVAAPWVLEATVTELYGDFEDGPGNPAAVMSIRFIIIDEKSARRRVIYERALSRRMPLPGASPEALLLGYGAALADILTQLATDLSNASLR
jgi:cholesterol transport system auxiliary component